MSLKKGGLYFDAATETNEGSYKCVIPSLFVFTGEKGLDQW